MTDSNYSNFLQCNISILNATITVKFMYLKIYKLCNDLFCSVELSFYGM